MSKLVKMHEYAQDLHVLVIDDDENISQVMHEFLSELFGHVDTVYDAEEALKLFESREYDVIFSDIMLPGISGLELATQVRNQNTDQKIVMISAHNEPHIYEEMIKIGVDAFVQKPFGLDRFVDKVFKVVKEAHFLKTNYEPKNEEIKSSRVLRATPVTDEPIMDTSAYVSANDLFVELNNDESFNEGFLTDNYEDLMYLKEDLEYQTGLFVIKDEKNQVLVSIVSILESVKGYLSISERLIPMAEVLAATQECINYALENELSEHAQSALLQLEYVFEDIAQFIHQVFEKKSALNVGYLHDSLLVSVKQIQKDISVKEDEVVDDGNDFEFF